MKDGKPLRVLSLGWGVQSWTLAAMVALGEIEPVDYAIHADTGHEREETYRHAAKWTPWLEEHGVKVVTVHGSRTGVVEEWQTSSVIIPAFTTARADGDQGQVRRQCTNEWKIRPIRAFLREHLPPRPGPNSVHSLQGISMDEWHRMRDSDVAYITNVYPLVEAKITRAGCVQWLESRNLPVPPKSACTFCPYHSLAAWKALKAAGGPDWREAVEVDEAIRGKRAGPCIDKPQDLFVHPARQPLPVAVRIPEDEGAHQEEMDFEALCDSGYCMV